MIILLNFPVNSFNNYDCNTFVLLWSWRRHHRQTKGEHNIKEAFFRLKWSKKTFERKHRFPWNKIYGDSWILYYTKVKYTLSLELYRKWGSMHREFRCWTSFLFFPLLCISSSKFGWKAARVVGWFFFLFSWIKNLKLY